LALSLDEGKSAVVLARETLESHVRNELIPKRKWDTGPLSENRGVFVTINNADPLKERLRGCIGFPLPTKVLHEAIKEATVAAATEDPRFPPVRESELDNLVVEVSVLTRPQGLVAPQRQDLPSKIRVGEDGLIITNGGYSGLLLPQVATEFGMDQLEFLSQACMKAGLPPDYWLDDNTKVEVFQAEIFTEETPRGKVVRLDPRES
jgi:uncharacterized protein (TIGR00296 family)